MKVLNKNHSHALTKSVKSVSLIVLASLLFACQGESSAQGESFAESAAASVTDSVEQATNSASSTATNVIESAKETVTQVQETVSASTSSVPATPSAPADFSTLDPKSYKAVSEPIAVSTGENIEVTELFWFGCSHCFALEPQLKSWLKSKPANAKFKKVPAIFSKRWEFHGKAFYTMEALNVPEKVYDDFFRQIHVIKRGINNVDDLVKFLAQYNLEKELVENTYNSFAVDSQYRNAVKITKASGARGVPAMIVDGKYLTSQSDAGGTTEMFEVVDKLVAKAASEK